MNIAGRLKFCGIWRAGTSVPLPFTTESVCDFRDDKTYEYSLDKYFPTTRVYVVGIRSNRTGRMIGPIKRGNEAEICTKDLKETGEFVSVEIWDYPIKD